MENEKLIRVLGDALKDMQTAFNSEHNLPEGAQKLAQYNCADALKQLESYNANGLLGQQDSHSPCQTKRL